MNQETEAMIDNNQRDHYLRQLLDSTIRNRAVISHRSADLGLFRIDGWIKIQGGGGSWTVEVEPTKTMPPCLRALLGQTYRFDAFWKAALKVGLLSAHLEFHCSMDTLAEHLPDEGAFPIAPCDLN